MVFNKLNMKKTYDLFNDMATLYCKLGIFQ